MTRAARLLLIAVLLVLGSATTAFAKDPLPKFTNYVVDVPDVVPAATESQVDAELAAYERSTTNQIAVAIVPTVGDRSLEDYSIDLARAWGVGQSGKDNGVLLLIVMNDRKLRIEVGRGLEGDLTDAQSGRIIRDVIAPRMKAEDVGGAVVAGTRAIRSALHDPGVGVDASAAPVAALPVQTSSRGSGGFGIFGLIFPIFILISVLGSLGGRGRRRRRGLMFFPPIFWGGGGWGGGGFGGGGSGGGGFGGGGFGGGGGGGFGGGGASGGW